MLEYFRPGGPFHTALVELFGQEMADEIRSTMLEAIRTGMGPRYVASALVRTLGQGLTWALRTARTSMLYGYREATIAGYRRNSHVVTGWRWHAHLTDDRVCMSCVAQHGTLHSLDEMLNDHHNGRCAMVPETILWSDLGVQTNEVSEFQSGRAWFDTLPEARQRQLMGQSMYQAWRDGAVSWADMSRPYHDQVYGQMLRTPSLIELLGNLAEEYY